MDPERPKDPQGGNLRVTGRTWLKDRVRDRDPEGPSGKHPETDPEEGP